MIRTTADALMQTAVGALTQTTFTVRFDQCKEVLASGIVIELIRDQNVDAIIGPTCSFPAATAGVISGFYNIPILVWGLSTSSALSDQTRFPTTAVMSVNAYRDEWRRYWRPLEELDDQREHSLGVAIRSVMTTFAWNQFAFVYSLLGDPEKCDVMRTDVQVIISLIHHYYTHALLHFCL
ncbi:hypothetical protein COOONC_23953 [Cooperia oncophora]